MSSEYGISIVICCYNSQERIVPTLQHLALLTNLEQFPYEVIIVDNNSSDNTVAVVEDFTKDHSQLPIKIVSELQQGLNFARLKGVTTSLFPYVLFCDDDNWLDSAYLAETHNLLQSYPNVGIIGGTGTAVSDVPLPSWFELHKTGYACFGLDEYTSVDITNSMQHPYGAGMVVKKELFHSIQFITTDRKGKSLASGGDTEMVLHARLLGYTILWSDKLKFQHFIPSGRLTWDYCKRLFFSFGQTEAYLTSYEFILSGERTSFRSYLMGKVKSYTKDLLSSGKRLYFLFFKDLEGEEYFTIYLRKWHFVKTALMEYKTIKAHAERLQNKR